MQLSSINENFFTPISEEYFFTLTKETLDYESLILQSHQKRLNEDLTKKIASLVSLPFTAYDRWEGVYAKTSILDIISLIRSYNLEIQPEFRINVVNVISKQYIKSLPLDNEKLLNETPLNLEIHAIIPSNKLLPNFDKIVGLFTESVFKQLVSNDKGLNMRQFVKIENQGFGIIQFDSWVYNPNFKYKIRINKTGTIIVGDPENLRNKKQDGEFCFGLKIN